jgi:hypothetical protein
MTYLLVILKSCRKHVANIASHGKQFVYIIRFYISYFNTTNHTLDTKYYEVGIIYGDNHFNTTNKVFDIILLYYTLN